MWSCWTLFRMVTSLSNNFTAELPAWKRYSVTVHAEKTSFSKKIDVWSTRQMHSRGCPLVWMKARNDEQIFQGSNERASHWPASRAHDPCHPNTPPHKNWSRLWGSDSTDGDKRTFHLCQNKFIRCLHYRLQDHPLAGFTLARTLLPHEILKSYMPWKVRNTDTCAGNMHAWPPECAHMYEYLFLVDDFAGPLTSRGLVDDFTDNPEAALAKLAPELVHVFQLVFAVDTRVRDVGQRRRRSHPRRALSWRHLRLTPPPSKPSACNVKRHQCCSQSIFWKWTTWCPKAQEPNHNCISKSHCLTSQEVWYSVRTRSSSRRENTTTKLADLEGLST